MGQIIYREYIVFRGSNISCSLATGQRVLKLAALPSTMRTLPGGDRTSTVLDRSVDNVARLQ